MTTRRKDKPRSFKVWVLSNGRSIDDKLHGTKTSAVELISAHTPNARAARRAGFEAVRATLTLLPPKGKAGK